MSAQKVKIELNDKQLKWLQVLLNTGLWGKSIEEVVVRMIDQRLWQMSSLAKQFGEDAK